MFLIVSLFFFLLKGASRGLLCFLLCLLFNEAKEIKYKTHNPILAHRMSGLGPASLLAPERRTALLVGSSLTTA